MKGRLIIEIISFMLILLFTYAAVSKLMQWQQFASALGRMPFFKNIPVFMAIGLPTTELIVAGLLFIPRTKIIGFYASLALMLLFTGYLGYMVLFVPALPCSCGGVLSLLTWRQHIVFNLFFIALATIGCRLMTIKNNSTVLLQ